jgi:anti-anti-sigma factor
MKNEPSEDLLAVEIEPLGDDVVVVRLSGEIDISSAHLLSSQFTSMVAQGKSAVIVDATKVVFMDSTGLHALVEGKRALHEHGARIFLVPSKQVRRVLELVFPDPLFAARLDSVEEAVAALNGEIADDRARQSHEGE